MSENCRECGAPTEVFGESFELPGAGFGPPNTEGIYVFQRQRCVLGHIYMIELDPKLIMLGDENDS